MAELISARDNPGTLREYECVLILRPDTLQEGIMEVNNKIKTLVGEAQGRLTLVENWGKRRLAYEIRKQLKGIYMYYQFLGHGDLVKEMERHFRISESVIRHFSVRVDENVDPEARPAELTDEAFIAASATRPDEEELATGYVMTGSGEKIPVAELGFHGFGDDDDDEDDDDDDDIRPRRGRRMDDDDEEA
ncbi:MAG: 30S ribosomal protein S6 [Polyangia bacterium]|jgi:small subunit ribosomal protein S6|nr:30S ribosomal protein S6 [Polyangia bacterium]